MLRAWGASSFLKKAATFSPTPRASLKPGTLRWMNAMGSPSRMLPFSPRSPISMNENSAQPPTKRPSGEKRASEMELTISEKKDLVAASSAGPSSNATRCRSHRAPSRRSKSFIVPLDDA